MRGKCKNQKQRRKTKKDGDTLTKASMDALSQEEVVQSVEKEVEDIIEGYEDFHDLRSLRKKLLFKHPKEVQLVQKMEKESREKKKQEFKSRYNCFHSPD
jgi:hypoxanthine-guanine phosphoribosyltransferase